MPENHRILYFSSQFPNLRNPTMGVFSLQRVQALHDAGCDVTVVSPVLMTPPPYLVAKPVLAYRWIRSQAQQPFELPLQGITAHYPKWICPSKKIFGWYMSSFLFLQVRSAVTKLAREFYPDVILSSWLPDGVAACQIGDKLNIPTLAIADGTDVNQWPKTYRGWKYARDLLNKKVSTLIFVSEALREVGSSIGLYGRRNVVIHNVVDTNIFIPNSTGRDYSEFKILAIGRLEPVKGFDILLQAFANVYKRLNQQTRLIIIGDGPLRSDLEKIAFNLEISSAVDFMGSIPHEEMVTRYQTADLLCVSSYSEGLPCVIVEAMACGKPVVASDVGGVSEVVDAQSGILVTPGDPEALCEALLKAKDQDWDREKIRQKIVIGFDRKVWAEKVIQLINSDLAYTN